MKDLIERLENATGPDRELDMRIALSADDCHDDRGEWVYRPSDVERDQRQLIPTPAYTYSIDEALSLVPAGFIWRVESPPDCYCVVGRPTLKGGFSIARGKFVSTHKTSPAIALCIAALKARAAQ